MIQSTELPKSVTVENCADEPIHIPGSVQPHGLLLVLDEQSLQITHLSGNSESLLGMTPSALLGQSIRSLIGEVQAQSIAEEIKHVDISPKNPFLKNINPFNLRVNTPQKDLIFNGIVHRANLGLVLELELLSEGDSVTFRHFYDLSRKSLLALQSTEDAQELYNTAAQEVRSLTGFDRVMIYRFDEQWDGDVIAEAQADGLSDSYLGLHFPSTDIPAQARALYLRNWLRFIPDVAYQPAPLVTTEDQRAHDPLDMSYCVLRSVSPIHLEYLQNMGVRATLTISLVKDNQLWGLIACHHLTPRFVPYQVRIASEYVGQILSLQLSLKQKTDFKIVDSQLREIHATLLETVARRKDYLESFAEASFETLTLTDSRGAAVLHEDEIRLIGQTPTAEQVADLLAWLQPQFTEIDFLYRTECLSEQYAPAADYSDVASGLLAMQVAQPQQSYILWFRPEVAQEVHWGGKPDKFVVEDRDGKYRLHPRRSFDLWRERVERTSASWEEHHINIAQALRNALKDVFIFKAEEFRQQKEALEQLNDQLNKEVATRKQMQDELEQSNAELERFAYVASHDLQEPLRATANFTSLLKKRYHDQLDEKAQRYIHFIVDGTTRMQTLINDILAFSRLQTQEKPHEAVNIGEVLEDVKQNLKLKIRENRAQIITESLPVVTGNAKQLGQLFQNLISNALKYRSPDRTPEIYVRGEERKREWHFTVRDNGIGIEKQYFNRIFIIFQRLHTNSEYEGTGVGLAICKRIVERHGGNIWLDSQPGQGTTFYFTINKQIPKIKS